MHFENIFLTIFACLTMGMVVFRRLVFLGPWPPKESLHIFKCFSFGLGKTKVDETNAKKRAASERVKSAVFAQAVQKIRKKTNHQKCGKQIE